MVPVSSSYRPAVIKGLTLHPDNPLRFDFIVDTGDSGLAGEALAEEGQKLIKYFLATLTVPEKELWVNLSPYENGRIISESFGQTEMGRDLLAQDYMLKQLSASLMYPEEGLGKKFWDRVYTKAYEQFGTTEIPMNTFNKIWIIPEQALVYEKYNQAFIIDSHLKVMLEEDYVALNHHRVSEDNATSRATDEVSIGLRGATTENKKIVSGVQSEVIRQILIPEIEREINEGETFANLRQIYQSVILATWYKINLKESLLGQVYVDQKKTKGVDVKDPSVKEKIYKQYLASFKKGVFNYIKEDMDPVTHTTVPRKYFSGGSNAALVQRNKTPLAGGKVSLLEAPSVQSSPVSPDTMRELLNVEAFDFGYLSITADLTDVGPEARPGAVDDVLARSVRQAGQARSSDPVEEDGFGMVWMSPSIPEITAADTQGAKNLIREGRFESISAWNQNPEMSTVDGYDIEYFALEDHIIPFLIGPVIFAEESVGSEGAPLLKIYFSSDYLARRLGVQANGMQLVKVIVEKKIADFSFGSHSSAQIIEEAYPGEVRQIHDVLEAVGGNAEARLLRQGLNVLRRGDLDDDLKTWAATSTTIKANDLHEFVGPADMAAGSLLIPLEEGYPVYVVGEGSFGSYALGQMIRPGEELDTSPIDLRKLDSRGRYRYVNMSYPRHRAAFFEFMHGVTQLSDSKTVSSPVTEDIDTIASNQNQIDTRNIVSVEDLKAYLEKGYFAVDITMEAFLDQIDDEMAQQALASGGLGFLAGETFGGYGKVGERVMGPMPMYEHFVDHTEHGRYIRVDWDRMPGVRPVLTDKDSRKPFRFSVNFNGDDYDVRVYLVLVHGTPVLLMRQPEINYALYPEEPGKVIQMAFLGRAYVELFKKLGIAPDVLRLNEPQLFFVKQAMENDITYFENEYFRERKEESIYTGTKIVTTTHTPEAAALPVYDNIAWLRSHIGEDLAPNSAIRDGRLDLARRLAESTYVTVINGVSQEHGEVTKLAVLPEAKDKIVAITNGSDPELWKSETLKALEKNGDVKAENLYKIGQDVKGQLNEYLQDKLGVKFRDEGKPLVGLIRRLVAYKEQRILFALIPWIVGDRDKKYTTPWGEKYGLEMNLLVGGVGRDDVGREWARQFADLSQREDLKGKFIFVPGSGTKVMKLATQASDVWVSMPRSTREAAGTSDQRAAFNGHPNIATLTGGPAEYITTGVNGWLMDVFKATSYSFRNIVNDFQLPDHFYEKEKIVSYYFDRSQELLAKYLGEASDLYYRYTEQGDTAWLSMMEASYRIGHERMSIIRMVKQYKKMFDFVREDTDVSLPELAESFKDIQMDFDEVLRLDSSFSPEEESNNIQSKITQAGYTSFKDMVHQAMQDNNLVGKAYEKNVYAIPGIDDFVLEVQRLAIINDQTVLSLVELEDKLPDMNVGQPVAELAVGVRILKKQSGREIVVPHYRPDTFEPLAWGESENRAELNHYYLQSLNNVSQAPQEAYDQLIRNMARLNADGMTIDFGVNSILLDEQDGKHFGIVDVQEQNRLSPVPNLFSVIYALTNFSYGHFYFSKNLHEEQGVSDYEYLFSTDSPHKEYTPEVTDARNIIFDRAFQAFLNMHKEGVNIALGDMGRMEWTIKDIGREQDWPEIQAQLQAAEQTSEHFSSPVQQAREGTFNVGEYFDNLPENGYQEALKGMTNYTPEQRQEMIFNTMSDMVITNENGERYRLFLARPFESPAEMLGEIDLALSSLDQALDEQLLSKDALGKDVYRYFRDGRDLAHSMIHAGWGDTYQKIYDNLLAAKTFMTADDAEIIREAYETLTKNIQLIWSTVTWHPHGMQNQVGERPTDTGWQTQFGLDQSREMDRQAKERVDQMGIPEEFKVYPRIYFMTRLIEKNENLGQQTVDWMKINQEYEVVQDQKGQDSNVLIIRVPFRDKEGEVIPEFIERRNVWPYLIPFVKEAVEKVEQEIKKDGLPSGLKMNLGNYSDGGLTAMISSMFWQDPYFWIMHASERSKNKIVREDGEAVYPQNKEQHEGLQYTADVLTGLSAYNISSSNHEKGVQFPDLMKGYIEDNDQMLGLLEWIGQEKILVQHAGTSRPLEDHEKDRETLLEEWAVLQRLVNDLKAMVNSDTISQTKRQRVILLIKKIYETNYGRFDRVLSGKQQYRSAFDENVLNAQVPENLEPAQLNTTIARLDDAKNITSLSSVYLGTREFRKQLLLQKMGEYLDVHPDEVNEYSGERQLFKQGKYFSDETLKALSPFLSKKSLRVLKANGFPAELLNVDFIGELKSQTDLDVSEKLKNPIKELEKLNYLIGEIIDGDVEILALGGLPERYVEEDYIASVEDPEIKEELQRLRELRERTVTLIIAGPETLEKSQTLEEEGLLNRTLWNINDNGLKDSVLHWGSFDGRKVYPLLANVDAVFIQPAYAEPYGLTVHEAAIRGMRMILSEHMGVTEVYKDFKQWIYDPGKDDGQLAENMIDMAKQSDKEARTLGLAFQRKYYEMAGWENEVKAATNYATALTMKLNIQEQAQSLQERNRVLRQLINKTLVPLIRKDFAAAINEEMMRLPEIPGDETSVSTVGEEEAPSSPVERVLPDEDQQSSSVGGIDLNPELLDLQIKRDGNGVPLPINLQPIESMQIEGFFPVIINIAPVNVPLLLGLNDLDADTEDEPYRSLLGKSDEPRWTEPRNRLTGVLETSRS